MRLIAHRGNIHGPNVEDENKPQYILNSISHGYDCEIDVRYIDDVLYLGHDEPSYRIELSFLIENCNKLWIHCKNIEALDYLIPYKCLNVFWHQEDNYTLTSHNYIWCYPKQPSTKRSIILMPEYDNFNIDKYAFGVCSDYVSRINENV